MIKLCLCCYRMWMSVTVVLVLLQDVDECHSCVGVVTGCG